ncbi:MAG: hypothetical protein ABL892_02715 [Thiobacillaceae bacterium]
METPFEIRPTHVMDKHIEASCYNRIRLAVLRLGDPLRIELRHHRGLDVIVHHDHWLCVDSFANDMPILDWRDFQVHARDNLYDPIACKLWLHHHCAGLIMGTALDDLEQAVEQRLHPAKD